MTRTLRDSYDGIGLWYTGEPILNVTIWLSAFASAVAALNLVADFLLEVPALSGMFSFVPVDRHFRLLTIFKATMLWLKMTLLMFTCFDCKERAEDHTNIIMLCFQVFSVLSTSLLACWSTIGLFGVSKQYVTFKGQYRSPRRLWACMSTSMITLAVVGGVM